MHLAYTVTCTARTHTVTYTHSNKHTYGMLTAHASYKERVTTSNYHAPALMNTHHPAAPSLTHRTSHSRPSSARRCSPTAPEQHVVLYPFLCTNTAPHCHTAQWRVTEALDCTYQSTCALRLYDILCVSVYYMQKSWL